MRLHASGLFSRGFSAMHDSLASCVVFRSMGVCIRETTLWMMRRFERGGTALSSNVYSWFHRISTWNVYWSRSFRNMILATAHRKYAEINWRTTCIALESITVAATCRGSSLVEYAAHEISPTIENRVCEEGECGMIQPANLGSTRVFSIM